VNVLHPGVEAKATCRRHLVGRIAGQENVADTIAVGNDGRASHGLTASTDTSRSATPTALRISSAQNSGTKSRADAVEAPRRKLGDQTQSKTTSCTNSENDPEMGIMFNTAHNYSCGRPS